MFSFDRYIGKDLDLSKIDDMVKIFRKLLQERTKYDNDGLNTDKPHCTTPAPGGYLGYVEGASSICFC